MSRGFSIISLLLVLLASVTTITTVHAEQTWRQWNSFQDELKPTASSMSVVSLQGYVYLLGASNQTSLNALPLSEVNHNPWKTRFGSSQFLSVPSTTQVSWSHKGLPQLPIEAYGNDFSHAVSVFVGNQFSDSSSSSNDNINGLTNANSDENSVDEKKKDKTGENQGLPPDVSPQLNMSSPAIVFVPFSSGIQYHFPDKETGSGHDDDHKAWRNASLHLFLYFPIQTIDNSFTPYPLQQVPCSFRGGANVNGGSGRAASCLSSNYWYQLPQLPLTKFLNQAGGGIIPTGIDMETVLLREASSVMVNMLGKASVNNHSNALGASHGPQFIVVIGGLFVKCCETLQGGHTTTPNDAASNIAKESAVAVNTNLIFFYKFPRVLSLEEKAAIVVNGVQKAFVEQGTWSYVDVSAMQLQNRHRHLSSLSPMESDSDLYVSGSSSSSSSPSSSSKGFSQQGLCGYSASYFNGANQVLPLSATMMESQQALPPKKVHSSRLVSSASTQYHGQILLFGGVGCNRTNMAVVDAKMKLYLVNWAVEVVKESPAPKGTTTHVVVKNITALTPRFIFASRGPGFNTEMPNFALFKFSIGKLGNYLVGFAQYLLPLKPGTFPTLGDPQRVPVFSETPPFIVVVDLFGGYLINRTSSSSANEAEPVVEVRVYGTSINSGNYPQSDLWDASFSVVGTAISIAGGLTAQSTFKSSSRISSSSVQNTTLASSSSSSASPSFQSLINVASIHVFDNPTVSFLASLPNFNNPQPPSVVGHGFSTGNISLLITGCTSGMYLKLSSTSSCLDNIYDDSSVYSTSVNTSSSSSSKFVPTPNERKMLPVSRLLQLTNCPNHGSITPIFFGLPPPFLAVETVFACFSRGLRPRQQGGGTMITKCRNGYDEEGNFNPADCMWSNCISQSTELATQLNQTLKYPECQHYNQPNADDAAALQEDKQDLFWMPLDMIPYRILPVAEPTPPTPDEFWNTSDTGVVAFCIVGGIAMVLFAVVLLYKHSRSTTWGALHPLSGADLADNAGRGDNETTKLLGGDKGRNGVSGGSNAVVVGQSGRKPTVENTPLLNGHVGHNELLSPLRQVQRMNFQLKPFKEFMSRHERLKSFILGGIVGRGGFGTIFLLRQSQDLVQQCQGLLLVQQKQSTSLKEPPSSSPLGQLIPGLAAGTTAKMILTTSSLEEEFSHNKPPATAAVTTTTTTTSATNTTTTSGGLAPLSSSHNAAPYRPESFPMCLKVMLAQTNVEWTDLLDEIYLTVLLSRYFHQDFLCPKQQKKKKQNSRSDVSTEIFGSEESADLPTRHLQWRDVARSPIVLTLDAQHTNVLDGTDPTSPIQDPKNNKCCLASSKKGKTNSQEGGGGGGGGLFPDTHFTSLQFGSLTMEYAYFGDLASFIREYVDVTPMPFDEDYSHPPPLPTVVGGNASITSKGTAELVNSKPSINSDSVHRFPDSFAININQEGGGEAIGGGGGTTPVKYRTLPERVVLHLAKQLFGLIHDFHSLDTLGTHPNESSPSSTAAPKSKTAQAAMEFLSNDFKWSMFLVHRDLKCENILVRSLGFQAPSTSGRSPRRNSNTKKESTTPPSSFQQQPPPPKRANSSRRGSLDHGEAGPSTTTDEEMKITPGNSLRDLDSALGSKRSAVPSTPPPPPLRNIIYISNATEAAVLLPSSDDHHQEDDSRITSNSSRLSLHAAAAGMDGGIDNGSDDNDDDDGSSESEYLPDFSDKQIENLCELEIALSDFGQSMLYNPKTLMPQSLLPYIHSYDKIFGFPIDNSVQFLIRPKDQMHGGNMPAFSVHYVPPEYIKELQGLGTNSFLYTGQTSTSRSKRSLAPSLRAGDNVSIRAQMAIASIQQVGGHQQKSPPAGAPTVGGQHLPESSNPDSSNQSFQHGDDRSPESTALHFGGEGGAQQQLHGSSPANTPSGANARQNNMSAVASLQHAFSDNQQHRHQATTEMLISPSTDATTVTRTTASGTPPPRSTTPQQKSNKTSVQSPALTNEQKRRKLHAGDVWGVGAILYAACSGRVYGEVARVLFTEVNDATKFNADVVMELHVLRHYSKPLVDVITRCLLLDPLKRPTTAELKEEVEKLLLS